MTIPVSVVVATYRRNDLLRRCLAALAAQTLDPSAFEIIIVDDGADPGTKALVEGSRGAGPADTPAVRYLAVGGGPRGPAVARNLGWRAACGEIIAFTDDDCIPRPDWLAAGVAAFTPGVIGVSGRIEMPLAGTPTDYELNAARLTYSEFVTANCFYRRAALVRAGGFDERFTIAWREDSDLFFTLMETGDSGFVDAPQAVVVHPIRKARWGVSLGQQRKNVFNALLYRKHRELYRARLGAHAPWNYYAIVAALLATLPALLSGRKTAARAAAALWLALTLWLSARRLRGTSAAPAHIAEMVLTSALIPPLALFWRMVGAIKYRVLFW
ncbi:MAG TPA: glycosyltransferase family A protein [Anaerolineae bacterium]